MDDVLDDAHAVLCKRLGSKMVDPSPEPLAAFVYRALFSEILDRIRKDEVRKRREAEAAEARRRERAELARRGVDPDLVLTLPLPDIDVQRILAWPNAGKTIVTLCLSGLWRCMPLVAWKSILQRAGVDYPFPPEGWDEAATTKEEKTGRYQVLGAVLGAMNTTLYKWWERGREELRSLESVRRLGGK